MKIRKNILHWLTLPSIHAYAMGSRNSELEQASIRVLIGFAALFYFTKTGFAGFQEPHGFHLDPICILLAFVLFALAIAICVVLWPGDKPSRRIISIFLDVGTLTHLFIIGGSHTAPLYFLYQWIIIGYGFRFGRRHLFIALGLSLLGFSLVIAVVPYWLDQLGISVGLWLGTFLTSIYFSILVDRLYNALNHAEEANRAKRQFICSVSHELRTPLNAIIGMIDLMRSTQLDREQQEMLESMTTTSQVMLSQIEDVLDFSKIEAGKMSVENIDFDLYQLVQSIIDIFRYQIDPFQIELSHSIGSEVPFLVKGDPHHLRQLLVNLLGNAVKFTEQGRVALRVSLLGTSGEFHRLKFSIKDTGIGISESSKEKIFESFTQADESTARRFGGTGLGTTICKQLVELMNGSIGFSSESGKGSEFWFELAFGIPEEHPKKAASGIFSSMRAMILASEAEPMSLISELIELSGMAPVIAHTADMGIALLDQALLAGTPVRLIFVDEPLRDGQTFDTYVEILRSRIQYFKQAGNHGKLTFVLITHRTDLEGQLAGVMDLSGLYSVLTLPPNRNSLTNILYAHWIDLNRSKPRLSSVEVSEKTPAVVTLSAMAAKDVAYEILVAEDNPTNRKVIQKILERAGHRCTLVKDGDEALDAIDKKSFDALVLDMNMPSVAGTDVARMCRLMQGDTSAIPIIMFSANVTSDAKRESIEAGADEFLPKPIQVEIFLRTLDKLIERRQEKSLLSGGLSSSVRVAVPVLFRADEPVLDLKSLEDLEQVSKDPGFIDDLITEFISDNKNLISGLEQAIFCAQQEKFREIVHGLKGSSLSVGAVSLKMICKRLEKLEQAKIDSHPTEIIRQINQAFGLLCEELEKYRKKRRQKFYEEDSQRYADR